MDKWSLVALVTSVRQLFLSCAKQIQPTLTHLLPGLSIVFFHSDFPISYTLTHLNPGLPSGCFRSVISISYTLTHLHSGLPSGCLHLGFSVSYTLTHLHPGLPSGFFHSNFPIFFPYVPYVLFISSSPVNGTNPAACQYGTFFSLLSLLPAENQESFSTCIFDYSRSVNYLNPLNPELNPICYLLALLGAHHFFHVSRTRVKLLTFRRLMSYIYGAPILDVSRSHTTTQHSR